eukprot:CAMPEP_0206389558 /NCGR_PEP_ID=MMETSP0294-20121207/18023_1 /ASSEMBLY_ACC=CAM_ASM_000327 /TAXON_ID=39354 /ORGANISM="Heterosigma akashiwo, Strain CCMP2393" /LENGTH=205 /DNA_ID=CAMNT_0053841645 /DNA_START=242 /DNA_END=859 /DNA_ORIENTATION=+
MPEKKPDLPPMNEEITAPQLRVVVANPAASDEALGILSLQEALEKAEELDQDLVLIAEKADPPVAKIMNYSRFLYNQQKKQKEQMSAQRAKELKEVKMSYKIEKHDYEVRAKAATKFLKGGHRVKLLVQFRGREQQHMDLGRDLLGRLSGDVEDLALPEPIRREGNRLTMLLTPRAELAKQGGGSGGASKKKKVETTKNIDNGLA